MRFYKYKYRSDVRFASSILEARTRKTINLMHAYTPLCSLFIQNQPLKHMMQQSSSNNDRRKRSYAG